jgi:hypothetical protein
MIVCLLTKWKMAILFVCLFVCLFGWLFVAPLDALCDRASLPHSSSAVLTEMSRPCGKFNQTAGDLHSFDRLKVVVACPKAN